MITEGYSLTTLQQRVGDELGVSDWLTVDQERINEFAECTGDVQWIHVDAERARRESPLGSTIAHGFLTLSLIPQWQFALGLFPDDAVQVINYGLDRVRFITPVSPGARIRDRVVLLGVEDRGRGQMIITTRNTVEIEGEEKPALVADLLALLVGRRQEAEDESHESIQARGL